MEESDIEQLSRGSNVEEKRKVLQKFLHSSDISALQYPSLAGIEQRLTLWTTLIELLETKETMPVHGMVLTVIRILSRDKTDLENIISDNKRWIKVLLNKAGLYIDDECPADDMSMCCTAVDHCENYYQYIKIEAMKCLCNLTYNSEISRAICADANIAQSLVTRVKTLYKDVKLRDDLLMYDMKLMFILTALREDIRDQVKELNGIDYLIMCLKEFVDEVFPENGDLDKELILQPYKYEIACDILKAQFNLVMQSGTKKPLGEEERAMFQKLTPLLSNLLFSYASCDGKMLDMHNNVANLLTSVPVTYYSCLTPLLRENEKAKFTYEGRNMAALQSLLHVLRSKLTATLKNNANQYEHLAPILTVMNKCVRVRLQRKYLRQVVLPPLRDVSQPPEKGTTLRNKLCRLLTTPVTVVRDLTAEFLFVLCKEKVGRMVKYTGFGNAAGHFAQKGLLGGSRSAQYSSSDDSDTEEYLEARPNIDPVVGCTRPPRANPFEGMTEEQKEHEAMKLVNLLDAMVTQGVVTPARIGPDGRPQPVEHVLELREDLDKQSEPET